MITSSSGGLGLVFPKVNCIGSMYSNRQRCSLFPVLQLDRRRVGGKVMRLWRLQLPVKLSRKLVCVAGLR